MAKLTQAQKIIEAFKAAPNNTLSMGYIERELYISQGNARLTELKQKGYEFEDAGKDEHGFKKHRLIFNPLLNMLLKKSAVKIEEIRAEVKADKEIKYKQGGLL